MRALPAFVALWTLTLNAALGVPRLAALGPTLPDSTDPHRHYLFYLHGAWIEDHGLAATHPQFGRYQYAEITQAFAARGFVVISEARQGPVDPTAYAQAIANQVKTLMGKGVPADNITVAGHSRGARIALLVASMLATPNVRFVIMAGCEKAAGSFGGDHEQFLQTRAPSLQGRMLSLYDRSDQIAGTCAETFAKAPEGTLQYKEVVLDTGRGHGLFFTPQPVWIEPVAAWSGLAP
jgi:hypothetical protein